jgi:hypothetical protein
MDDKLKELKIDNEKGEIHVKVNCRRDKEVSVVVKNSDLRNLVYEMVLSNPGAYGFGIEDYDTYLSHINCTFDGKGNFQKWYEYSKR